MTVTICKKHTGNDAVAIVNQFSEDLSEHELSILFDKFLNSQNCTGTWSQKVLQIVNSKYYKATQLFDINDASDLYQNALIMLFKFFCKKKFEIVNDKMLSSIIYDIVNKSTKLITRQRYYDKRKVELGSDGKSIYYRDLLTYFDDCVDQCSGESTSKISDVTSVSGINDASKGVLIDSFTLRISDGKNVDERLYFEKLISECRKRMTRLQYKIFYRCFVRCDKTLSDIAIQEGYTTSNIVQIKIRHIERIVKNVIRELSNGTN